ncbi:MAG: helix-hairpin-helix domain-containing protein [candidate division WOR-3 bacterium]
MSSNLALAKLFWEMAQAALYLREDEFVARAYRSAYEIIKNFPGDLREFYENEGKDGLMSIKGIGPAIASKIAEYFQTGRIKKHDELLSAVPPGALALMRLKGIGPATARRLHDDLGITGPEELAEAISSGRLEGVPGFGKARINALRKALGLE